MKKINVEEITIGTRIAIFKEDKGLYVRGISEHYILATASVYGELVYTIYTKFPHKPLSNLICFKHIADEGIYTCFSIENSDFRLSMLKTTKSVREVLEKLESQEWRASYRERAYFNDFYKIN